MALETLPIGPHTPLWSTLRPVNHHAGWSDGWNLIIAAAVVIIIINMMEEHILEILNIYIFFFFMRLNSVCTKAITSQLYLIWILCQLHVVISPTIIVTMQDKRTTVLLQASTKRGQIKEKQLKQTMIIKIITTTTTRNINHPIVSFHKWA